MWIRRLEVADCAGVAAASVALRRGLNVLHGPNELGKSSLLEAVRAALLLQSGSSAASALDDWHSDGSPTVALTFEQEAQKVWRVRKTFKRGGGQAFLEFSRDGHDFSTDSRGREVDDRMNKMLGWGATPPGGKGGPRGMPSTLITTALLGRQDEVTAILEGSLANDPTESGREQLMRALEGLAEDPRLKNLLGAVQEEVDVAYTATGRRKGGRGSPWTQLREERLAAEKGQQEVRSRQEESEGVRRRVNELQQEQTVAEAVWKAARRDLEGAREAAVRHDELEKAKEAFLTAEEEAKRIETLIRTRDEASAAVEATDKKVAELSSEQAELERTAGLLGEQLEEARARVREVEAGDGEQERRLREQEVENRLLEVVREQEELDRRIENAERFADLDSRIAELDGRIAEKEQKLAEAQRVVEEAGREDASDRRRSRELEEERLTAVYLAACGVVERRASEHEAARKHAAEAAAGVEEAAALRKAADDLQAPNSEEIERLKKLETDLRIAREKLAVGLVVELDLQAGATADVRVDGETEAVGVEGGRRADFEARRELRVDIPGVGVVHARGGGKALAVAADAAEQEFETVRQPLLERAGVSTEPELEELRRRAESLRGEAEERDRSVGEARVRAEGLEALERDEALARGDLDRSRLALAEALGEGASVEEHIRGLNEQPREESEIVADIEVVERRVSERREMSHGLESKLELGAADLVRDREDLEAKGNELLRADTDWRGLLAGAVERREKLARQKEAAENRLEAVQAEAAVQVDQAKEKLKKTEREVATVQSQRDALNRALSSQREELAGLKSAISIHEDALKHEDLEAAREKRERHRETKERQEEDLAGVALADIGELERAAGEAEGNVSRITEELQKRRGALEQVGGAYAEEQALQAQERVDAVREREADLEVEYEAWKLLAETLREVEKQETAHLGKALVGPVSSRISELTGGRYGDLAIGPELDAGGIHFGGSERTFSELSVGTREQIALLLRISIAETLGAFVVLDDQLTQTDESRMAWLRELLEEAAARIQIIVLTCHPEDYGSSATTHVVDLASRVRRSERST